MWSAGTSLLWITNMVSMSTALPSSPWHTQPNSLPNKCSQGSSFFGRFIRWPYYSSSPVSPSITELAHSHMNWMGNLLPTRSWLDNFAPVPDISSIRNNVSCALILWTLLAQVLNAGFFFSNSAGGVTSHCLFSRYTLYSNALCFCILCRSTISFLAISAFFLKISMSFSMASLSMLDCGIPPWRAFFKSFTSSSIASAFVLVGMVGYLCL